MQFIMKLSVHVDAHFHYFPRFFLRIIPLFQFMAVFAAICDKSVESPTMPYFQLLCSLIVVLADYSIRLF